MSKIELKSYDIASFDIELEYNKKITPITKKMQRLNSNHESKSLNAHKDFLSKEKKSKEKLNELNDKAVIKNQKIEKAVENKIKKLRSKENRIKKEFDAFVVENKELADTEYTKINEVTEELKIDEQNDIKEIKAKYKTNIESYVEKLDIYNSNFEKNKQFHVKEIEKHQNIINENLDKLKAFNENVVSQLDEKLNEFLNHKNNDDKVINDTTSDTSRVLSNMATNIRKKSNINISEIKDYVEEIKNGYENHLEPEIHFLSQTIQDLKREFEARRVLIEKDLERNIQKLEKQLEEYKDAKNRKATKNVNMKINLFNVRATTTIKYEERILNEKITVLEHEKKLLEDKLKYELFNIDRLSVFLLNDESELKETGDYFKELNLVLKTELNNFELANNNYLLKHEQLKTDFIKNYTRIFSDLKESTINLAQTYLEKIADNNFEIDDINKFLDTAEPLKEIEVNRLREDIEISEVIERFKIKYAKQDYETKVIKNAVDTEILIAELGMKEQLSDTNKEHSDIKNKELYDKALEKAKLKHSRAQEVYTLRLNNTKLERNLLKNKFDTELAISKHKKELTEIDVRKHNALISKEIEYAIKNNEMEANYKIEVINKGLEEDLLKLEEKVSKAKYEKDAYSVNLNIEIEQKKTEIDIEKDKIEIASKEKLSLIEQALERELREPSRNILKTETIVDERLSKLDINNAIFVDFINDSTDDYKDPRLSQEQIREVIINNETVYEKSTKYINRTYQTLNEAVKFMNDIEKHALLNQIAAASDQSVIKRLKRQQLKLEQEHTKQTTQIKTSENDHIVLIKNYIREELTQIKKGNYNDINHLVEETEISYNKIFNHLKDLQENIKKEIAVLYSPLTKNDQELIDNANLNAEKAKALVEEDKQNAFIPLDQDLESFTNEKEEIRANFNNQFDEEIKELRAEINHHKNEALDKVKEINDEKNQIVNAQLEQKQALEETEDKEITKRYEDIDNRMKELEQNYNEALSKLDEKDQEAKKIFDYEDRIYNIAVESATARFNDANVKTKNRHLNNVKTYRNQIDNAKKDKDRNLNSFNKELLDLTNKFEKNIFTVRPRLEESIGDAQKAIDKELNEKEQKLKELIENNNKIILTAENALYTTFHEGYDRLNDNLSNYIEKYRIIENEYIDDNKQSNDILNANNITFSSALFELNKNKHNKTMNELISIDRQMLGEEEL